MKKVYNVLVTIYRPILIVVGVVFVEKHIMRRFSDFAGQITKSTMIGKPCNNAVGSNIPNRKVM